MPDKNNHAQTVRLLLACSRPMASAEIRLSMQVQKLGEHLEEIVQFFRGLKLSFAGIDDHNDPLEFLFFPSIPRKRVFPK